MMLLPPAEGTCPICATKHESRLPHNAQSLYYLAGWFDGEGSFILHRFTVRGRPQILVRASLSNTHRPTLDDLLATCGGKIRPEPPNGGRPAWRWELHGFGRLASFCREIGPHLREKQQEAAVVRLYCERRLAARRAAITRQDEMFVEWLAHVRSYRAGYRHNLYDLVRSKCT